MRLLIYVFAVVFLTIVSCKKEPTNEPPIVRWESPAFNEAYYASEDIPIQLFIEGNGDIIKKIDLSIVDINDNIIGEAINISLLHASYELRTLLTVPNRIPKRGHYRLRAAIGMEKGNFRSFRQIYLEPKENKLLGAICVFKDGTLQSIFDTTYITHYPSQPFSQYVGSLNENLLVTSSSSGILTIYNTNNLNIKNQVSVSSGGLSNPIRTIGFNQDNQTCFIGTADGRIIGYNEDLQVVYNQTKPIRENFYPIHISIIGQQIIQQWAPPSGNQQQRLLGYSNLNSPNIGGETPAPFDIFTLAKHHNSQFENQLFMVVQDQYGGRLTRFIPTNNVVSNTRNLEATIVKVWPALNDSFLILFSNQTMAITHSSSNSLQFVGINQQSNPVKRSFGKGWLVNDTDNLYVQSNDGKIEKQFKIHHNGELLDIFPIWER